MAETLMLAVVGVGVVVFLIVLVVQANARNKKERAEILAKEIEEAQSAIERMEAADGDISKLTIHSFAQPKTSTAVGPSMRGCR